MASRIEELRTKLRTKPFDAAFSAFNSRVEEVLASERCASAGSTTFMHDLYASFEDEAPGDLRPWLDGKLADLFQSVAEKPVWAGEPGWCFLEDRPMTFVHQFEDEHGTTFYVFRSFRPGETGPRAVYKMTAQDPEGQIILTGEILG